MTAPALVDAPASTTWSGLLLPTNTPAGDGRVMLHDGSAEVPARPLPLPLLAQRALAEGHEGAIRVGMIRRLWMEPDGVYGEGTFNDDPDGREWADRVARGEGWVSIDLSDVRVEQVPVDDDGNDIAVEADDVDAADLSAQMQMRITGWKVMGATLVSQPAFETARIGCSEHTTAPAPDAAMYASLTAAGIAFDSADFSDPHLDGPTALTIDDSGRVYGHLATWGTCHIGYAGVCVTAPSSPSDYAYFRQGLVRTSDGAEVPVGKITMSTGHAGTGDDAVRAAAHYDNTGAAVAVVAAGEDTYGVWVSGHVLPGVTQAQVDTLRHSGISGDWREIGGSLELVAALAVNVPGFPVPRTLAASGVLIAAGVVTPGAAQRARAGADRDELAVMRRRVSAAALAPMRARMHAAETVALRARVLTAAGEPQTAPDENTKGQRIVRTQEGADRYGVAIGDPIPVGGTKPATSMDSDVSSVWEKIKAANPAGAESKSKGKGGKGSSSKKAADDDTTKGEVPSGSKKLGSSTSARKSGDSAFMEEDESPDEGAKGGTLTKFEAGVAYYDDGTMSDGKSWYTAGAPKAAKTSTKTTGTKATRSSEVGDDGATPGRSDGRKATSKDSTQAADPIANVVQSILALFTGKPPAATGPRSTTQPPAPDMPREERIRRTRELMAELENMLNEEQRQQPTAGRRA